MRPGTAQRANGVKVVRGWGQIDGQKVEQMCTDPIETQKPFRCCADHTPTFVARKTCDELGWKVTSGQASCGASENLGGTKELAKCYVKHDWDFAAEACSRQGARLCSTAEVLSGVGKSTGCGLDSKRIWTGDACNSEGYYSTVKGNGNAKSVQCNPSGKNRNFRCCSDTNLANQPAFVALPPIGTSVPAKTCAELVGATQAGFEQMGTKCAASKIKSAEGIPTCWATRTFEEALEICSSAGARLCTLEEAKGVAMKTGCNFDLKNTWLAASEHGSCAADEAKIHKGYKQSSTKCVAKDKTQAVRCCQDA